MPEEFKIHHWLVKPQTTQLVGAAQTHKLDHKVMQLLVYLAQNSGQDLSKEKILRAVWGEGVFSEEVLTVAISNLRQVLGWSLFFGVLDVGYLALEFTTRNTGEDGSGSVLNLANQQFGLWGRPLHVWP